MIRTLLLIAVLCMVLVAFLPTGCGSSGNSHNKTEELPSPDPELVVSAVRDLGAIVTNPAILRRDCGFSALYQGKSVWVFGDTVLDVPNADNRTVICNSWSSTYDLDAGDGIAGFTERVDDVGAPVEFFPLTEEEKIYNEQHAGEFCEEEPCFAHWAIWPGAIIVDDDKGWAYVFYRKVHVEHGLFAFYHVGHSLAVWKNYSDPLERPVFELVDDYPTLFFSEDEDGFGSAALLVGREVYVYGCELDKETLKKPCHLGRVPIADILVRSAWSFYSRGDDWSPDVAESKDIFYGNDMMSVFFIPYIGRYAVVYSEPMGARAMLRTADKPEGPWTEPIELFAVEASDNAYGWVYDVLAHPEFSDGDGRTIYVTYSKKLNDTESEMRLKAVELELSY